MRLKILGNAGNACSVNRTTSAIINDSVALDMGTGFHQLELDEMLAISDVLLTHSHLDHTAMLCFWIDCHTISGSNVTIHCLQETADDIRHSLLNDKVWPDMTQIMVNNKPAVRFNIIKPFQTLTIGDISVTPLPVNHGIPTLSFCLHGSEENFVFGADISDAPDTFWRYLRKLKNFRHLTLEISFPNEMEELAKASYHLTPIMLEEMLIRNKIPDEITILYNHHKVQYIDLIKTQVLQLKHLKGRIRLLEQGTILTL